jgi:hypothetical protein
VFQHPLNKSECTPPAHNPARMHQAAARRVRALEQLPASARKAPTSTMSAGWQSTASHTPTPEPVPACNQLLSICGKTKQQAQGPSPIEGAMTSVHTPAAHADACVECGAGQNEWRQDKTVSRLLLHEHKQCAKGLLRLLLGQREQAGSAAKASSHFQAQKAPNAPAAAACAAPLHCAGVELLARNVCVTSSGWTHVPTPAPTCTPLTPCAPAWCHVQTLLAPKAAQAKCGHSLLTAKECASCCCCP